MSGAAEWCTAGGGRPLGAAADWCMWFDTLQNELPGGAGSLAAVREAETWHQLCTGPSLTPAGTPEAARALRALWELGVALRGAGPRHDRELAIAAARGQLLLAKIALRRSLAAEFPPLGERRPGVAGHGGSRRGLAVSWAPSEALLAWARRWPGAYDGGRRTPEANEERRAWRAFFDEVDAVRLSAAYDGLPAEVRAAFAYSKISLDMNDAVAGGRAVWGAARRASARRELAAARADELREKEELHQWIAERRADREYLAMMDAADS